MACTMGQIQAAEQKEEQTVGSVLDQRIQAARNELERLCVLKAKCEATQLLNVPMDIVGGIIF